MLSSLRAMNSNVKISTDNFCSHEQVVAEEMDNGFGSRGHDIGTGCDIAG